MNTSAEIARAFWSRLVATDLGTLSFHPQLSQARTMTLPYDAVMRSTAARCRCICSGHSDRRAIPDRRACSDAAEWARSIAPTTCGWTPVALKFLPPSSIAMTSRRSAACRSAPRAPIAHPNVCRVYDIGEADGQHFLSMEYIDGEDLGSLFRRIGRLPPAKALDIARQLCAGLAAAHKRVCCIAISSRPT